MKANHKFFKMDPIPRLSEAVVQRCSVKKTFLEISQSSQENNRASFLIKLQASPLFIEHLWWLLLIFAIRCLARYSVKRLWHRCFSVNFAKFLSTPFYIEHLWWLILGFTSHIFEWHERKTGGKRKVWYNFPDLTRLKLPKFSRT